MSQKQQLPVQETQPDCVSLAGEKIIIKAVHLKNCNTLLHHFLLLQ